MIGYNVGKVLLVVSQHVRALLEANVWDCLPLAFHLTMARLQYFKWFK